MKSFKQRPPSPPLSGSDEVQFSRHHNEQKPYCSPLLMAEDSRGQLMYKDMTHGFGRPDTSMVGLGIHSGKYPTPEMFHDPTSAAYPMLIQNQHNEFPIDVPADPPPTLTPALSVQSPGDRSSRANKSADSHESPRSRGTSRAVKNNGISKSPKPKKQNKQNKVEKHKMPKLVAPLSELTRDFKNIPIRDMEAWVNRSVEDRQQEVEKRKGHIARPMNSFMLYRSAYAERTKIWCLQNNHQVVSSVSGESWPLEPDEIRDRYNELAKLERINHQNAHPEYKFTPGKSSPQSRKRKSFSEDELERTIDADDADFEWMPRTQRKIKQKSNPHTSKSSNESIPLAIDPYSISSGAISSMYHTSNPGRPLPAPMDRDGMYGQYYETNIQPYMNLPSTEDVTLRRTESPMTHYTDSPPIVGLPGGLSHYDFMQQPSYGSSSDDQLDPTLLNWEHSYAGQGNGGLIDNGELRFDNAMAESYFTPPPGMMEHGYGYDTSQSFPMQPTYPQFNGYHMEDSWRFDHEFSSVDGRSDFENWMEEPNRP